MKRLMLLTLFLTSCVSKGQYDSVLQERIDLEVAVNKERRAHQSCLDEAESLREVNSRLESQSSNLRNTNQLLAQKNSSLSQEVFTVRNDQLRTKKELEKRDQAIEYASKTYEDLVKSLKSELQEGQVKIEEMKNRLSVSLVDRILFPAGTVSIDESGKQVLEKVAKILKEVKDKRIQVEGHSDNTAVNENMRKLYPTNWELSARRATEVVRFLENKGVPAANLAAVGLAHFHPIADNKTPEGRNSNRRIEIILLPKPALADRP